MPRPSRASVQVIPVLVPNPGPTRVVQIVDDDEMDQRSTDTNRLALARKWHHVGDVVLVAF